MGEIIFHIGLLIFFTGFYIHSFTFKIPKGIKVSVHPAFWPRLVFGLAILLTVYSLFLIILRKKKKEKASIKKEGETLKGKLNFSVIGPVGIGVLTLISLAILYQVGFIISSFLLVLSTMYWIQGKFAYHLKVISLSIIIVLIFVLVFGNFLTISLPRGFGVFRELSYFLY